MRSGTILTMNTLIVSILAFSTKLCITNLVKIALQEKCLSHCIAIFELAVSYITFNEIFRQTNTKKDKYTQPKILVLD